ncbi:hypothetical protein BpJC7_00390 [Weizmannia acidilactici]|uniref:Uncharacterized protein n=1 Tax=Weizmannia acidilactici TaxID=2607726 RepID=A0A5J4J1D7_9BACI|nr:DUF6230 family protein [Weizmannia acidilactici]GER67463.1 hypothetical protein BpJC4_19340 [Weizmannia acidilactici]GER68736.1 hypothetical protein BpJC7_00390 [Weizmannia acidilactici]GER74218.1 hypothetical protein BpPP18_22850 [Weizmannia acidilactici]
MNEGALVIQGKTSKKWFFSSLLAGLLFLGGLLAVLGINGVAVAASVGGIGKFNVSFKEMQGQGFKLYGDLYGDPSKGADHVKPVFVNEIDQVTIQDLVIAKNVSIPLLGDYQVKITAGDGDTPVHLKGLIQKAALIQGDAVFTNMNISENYVTADDPEAVKKGFTQGSDTLTIRNGSLDTHYLFQKVANLPDLKVQLVKK